MKLQILMEMYGTGVLKSRVMTVKVQGNSAKDNSGIQKQCDMAADALEQNLTRKYTSTKDGKVPDSGVGYPGKGGCKIYVQGRDADTKGLCTFTGAEMSKAYREILQREGCETCGTRHYSNECMVSINKW